MEISPIDSHSARNELTNVLESTQILEASVQSASTSHLPTENISSVFNEDISPEELEDLFDKNTESFRCLAQVLISRSSIYGHPLYNFDPPKDPGIEEAFNFKQDLDLSLDTVGIQSYKNQCKEYEIVPISRVIKSLPTDTLDLRYYGLSLKQIKALSGALVFNRYVENLILEENVLDSEAIYHLSEMLRDNNTISYLNLKNCWISSSAIKNLSEGIFTTQILRELDLSYNNIRSSGLASLERSIRNNMSIKKLNLSHNQLQGDVGRKLGRALADNDCLEELDLSWNNLIALDGLLYICEGLKEKDKLKVLNLSWNGISTKEALIPVIKYMKASTALEHLDLSNNQMQGLLIKMVRVGILGNSSLISVNMSSNIITAEEASSLAHVFTAERGDIQEPLKLKYLDMENVYVEKKFLPYWRKQTREGKFVKFEGIHRNYKIIGPDVKKLLFDRIRYLSQKVKRKKPRKEFGHFLHNITKTVEKPGKGKPAFIPDPDGMLKAEFLKGLRKFKIGKISKDQDLLKEIIKRYTINKDKVNTFLMKKEYYDYYPDTTIPEVKKKKGARKGKSKKKKKVNVDEKINDDAKESTQKIRIEDVKNEVDYKSKNTVSMEKQIDRPSFAIPISKEFGNELLKTDKGVENRKASTTLSTGSKMWKMETSKSILKKKDSKEEPTI